MMLEKEKWKSKNIELTWNVLNLSFRDELDELFCHLFNTFNGKKVSTGFFFFKLV